MYHTYMGQFPSCHASGRELRNTVIEAYAAHADHVHLVGRVVQRPIQRPIVADRRYHYHLKRSLRLHGLSAIFSVHYGENNNSCFLPLFPILIPSRYIKIHERSKTEFENIVCKIKFVLMFF